MARMRTGGEIFVAREPMFIHHGGVSLSIQAGQTVRGGHPILVGREEAFAPFAVDFDLDDEATAPSPQEQLKQAGAAE